MNLGCLEIVSSYASMKSRFVFTNCHSTVCRVCIVNYYFMTLIVFMVLKSAQVRFEISAFGRVTPEFKFRGRKISEFLSLSWYVHWSDLIHLNWTRLIVFTYLYLPAANHIALQTKFGHFEFLSILFILSKYSPQNNLQINAEQYT